MLKTFSFFLLSLLCMWGGIGAALAAPRGAVSGTVTDTAGQPLPGVVIRIPDLRNGTVTDVAGRFQILNVPEGRYLVTATMVGYASISQTIQTPGPALQLILRVSALEVGEVVVTGHSRASAMRQSPAPILAIGYKALHEQASPNIIAALARQPGISQVSTGPAISKPVIRGLGYNRIVTLHDNIRQEGQQWGDEHGIEIDDYAVARAEVLKGPASLAYGADALAGVINLLPPEAPVDPLGGRAVLNYQTNARLAAAHLFLGGTSGNFSWTAYGTGKMAQDYRNRYDGSVYNSRFNNADGGLSAGWRRQRGITRFSFYTFNQRLGIPEGERDSATGRFVKSLVVNGQPEEFVTEPADFHTYATAWPYQKINHHKAVLEEKLFLRGGHSLDLDVALQQNNRREFETPGSNAPGLSLRLRTLSYSAIYHPASKGVVSWTAGLQGMRQWNRNLGEEYLVPDYNLTDLGAYVLVQGGNALWHWSGGLRADGRHIAGASLELNDEGEPVQPGQPVDAVRFAAFSRSFLRTSASLGVAYTPSATWAYKANLSSGFRAPNIAELAANGVHEGTIRYEYGNHDLAAEQSLQADLGASYRSEHLELEGAVFVNHIFNYIFLQKLPGAASQDSIPTQNNDEGYAAYAYRATGATLYGGELSMDLHPHPLDWLHLELTGAVVWGHTALSADSMRYLPAMPQARVAPALRAALPAWGKQLRNLYARVEASYHFAQHRAFTAYGTELPSPAYLLIHAALGADVTSRKGQTLLELTISANNLADVAYQDHLSRLRYAPVNGATGRMGIWGMGRSVSVMVAIPFGVKGR